MLLWNVIIHESIWLSEAAIGNGCCGKVSFFEISDIFLDFSKQKEEKTNEDIKTKKR